jgi:multidrug efflux pump subunit AcrB
MIPLSLLGVFWGHGIHDKPLSIMSLWGMVALTGVIINDAIIFMAKYDRFLLEGLKVDKAIVEAGKSRLRPILLTTITTSVGLFPLLLEQSIQAQFLIPMAISLAYGVAIGTVFILIFFPVLIILLNDFRRLTRYILSGVVPEKEDVEVAIKNYRRKLRYEQNEKNEHNK